MSFSANPINQMPEGGGNYNGYDYGLGQTADHLLTAPVINPINGKIVVLVIGASVPKAVTARLETVIAAQLGITVKSSLVIVNGCVPSTSIKLWKSKNGSCWNTVTDALATKGVTYAQVQVILTMQDDLESTDNTFPTAPISLKNQFKTLITTCKQKCKKLKQVHIIPRIYTGWCDSPQHVEPCAYNNGWSAKWLVEEYRSGFYIDMWVNDGCYFWTDGETIRQDGVQMLMTDFDTSDPAYLHLTTDGNIKMANFWHTYLLQFAFYHI